MPCLSLKGGGGEGGSLTIQIMAIQEHAYYGSLGYHVTSFFGVRFYVCRSFDTPYHAWV
jgi:hypothetical protein